MAKEKRREEIISAALELFAFKGHSATKISLIATKTGMSQGLLYHYFSSNCAWLLCWRQKNAVSDETLRDDTTRFAQKAKDAGVDVTLRVGKGLFHCYPACAPFFPEAKKAMEEICAFARKVVGEQGV